MLASLYIDEIFQFVVMQDFTTSSGLKLICLWTADEYVICNGCKSPDTILSKENRLFFLRCEKVVT